VAAHQYRHHPVDDRAGQSQSERDFPRLERLHADRGLHHLAENGVGFRLGDLLDLDTTVRMGDQHDALGLPVQHEADIHLALDRYRRFHVEPMDHLALGPGLVGDEALAEQLGRGLPHFILGAAELDPARLAAAAGVDLRLHGPARTTDLRRAVDRLLRAVGHAAARNRDAEVGEQLYCLVFVDIHASPHN
jgi:hypothetical protein